MRPRRDTRWQPPWRLSGHAAAWRNWTGGCPQAAAPICGAVPRWQRGSPATPARSNGPSRSLTSLRSSYGPPARSSPNLMFLQGTASSAGSGNLLKKASGTNTRTPTNGSIGRIEQELAVIEAKNFPGYFLIVHDIVQFARARGILCQGRGSAANSAVCYALGITAVDSIFYDLPFERFLSSLREEEPDIDVDFDSDRREEVIQYVYAQIRTAQRGPSSERHQLQAEERRRDMAKALGYSQGQQDAWSKQLDHWGDLSEGQDQRHPGPGGRPCDQLLRFPAAPGHPLRRHGAHRPAGRRGVPDRARPDGEPHRPAMGQGRLRLDGPGQVRPARARACSPRCSTPSI